MQSGSLISFKDFQSNLRYYCFNVSRTVNNMVDPNKPVSVWLVGNRAGGNVATPDVQADPGVNALLPRNADATLYAVIEFQSYFTINMSTGVTSSYSQT